MLIRSSDIVVYIFVMFKALPGLFNAKSILLEEQ